MKILILSDANSIHTIRWVKSLSRKNLDIELFSLFKPNENSLQEYIDSNVNVTTANLRSQIKHIRSPKIEKIKYLKSFFLLKKVVKKFNPDIVHAHYASSYGILGLFCRIRPLILSVWGSDIYLFPSKNIFYKILIKYVIKRYDAVCSTSNDMKKLILEDFKRGDLSVVPFGINLNEFYPLLQTKTEFTVGTIKSIEDHNGIDCLIDAAKIVISEYKINANFIIVGEGSLRKKLQRKVLKLN